MELEKELAYFLSVKEELLIHHKNQFALIKDKQLISTYTTWEEAFEDAVKKLGNTLFLIKRVQEEEELIQFPALAVGAIGANP